MKKFFLLAWLLPCSVLFGASVPFTAFNPNQFSAQPTGGPGPYVAVKNGVALTNVYMPEEIAFTFAYFDATNGLHSSGIPTNAVSGITINPTDDFLPVRSSSTVFADSGFYRLATTNIGFNGKLVFGPGTTNVLYRSGNYLVYTNADTGGVGGFRIINNSGETFTLSQNGSNQAILHSSDNSGVAIAIGNLIPEPGVTMDLGRPSTSTQFRDGMFTRDLFIGTGSTAGAHIAWNGATNSVIDTVGTGSPESVVTANASSTYKDMASGSIYRKTGTGNTGWVLMGSGSAGTGESLWYSGTLTDVYGGTVYVMASTNTPYTNQIAVAVNNLTNIVGEPGIVVAMGFPLMDMSIAKYASDLFSFGGYAGQNQSLTNSASIYTWGNTAGYNQSIDSSYNIFNHGKSAGSGQALTNAENVYNYGGNAGLGQVGVFANTIFNFGSGAGSGQILDHSGPVFNYGQDAGNGQYLTNCQQIYNYGFDAHFSGSLTNSSDIYSFGSNTEVNGDGLSHVFLIGSGAKGTNSNDYVFGDSAYNYFFPGASMRVEGPISATSITIGATNLIGAIADKITGPAVSADNDIVGFSGTGGKTGKVLTSAGTFGDASSATFDLSFNLSGASDPHIVVQNALLAVDQNFLTTQGLILVTNTTSGSKLSSFATAFSDRGVAVLRGDGTANTAQLHAPIISLGSNTNDAANVQMLINSAGGRIIVSSGTFFEWSSLASGSGTSLNTSGDLKLGRSAAANLRQGAADAASPVAQTSSVQNVVAGTSNTAGANRTYDSSQGTGTGPGGSHVFRVAPAGTTGTAQNALVAALTLDSTGTLTLQKTTTAGGTTGAQTINKPTGSVNFAAAATSLVVTDSIVTANSYIFLTIQGNDTTMKSVTYTATAGSFTIFPDAAPTAETRVNFMIVNP